MKKHKVMVGSDFYTKAKYSLRRAPGLKCDRGHIYWPTYETCFESIVAIDAGVNNAIQDKS